MTQTTQFDALINLLQQLVLLQRINSKPVLTIEEAAIYTGRSTSNLYKLTSQGVIPYSKPYGSRIYFDRGRLDAWMLQNPVKTATQIDQEAATQAVLSSLSAPFHTTRL